MNRLIENNFILQYVNERIINPPEEISSTDEKCQNIGRELLYATGAALGFAGQLAFISLSKQASSNPVLSNILAAGAFTSAGIFFSWLYRGILDETLTTHPEHLAPHMEKQLSLCKKTTIVSLSILLGLAAIAPDIEFAYEYNNHNLIYPILSTLGLLPAPLYSIMKAFKALVVRRLTPGGAKLQQNREILTTSIATTREHLLTDPIHPLNNFFFRGEENEHALLPPEMKSDELIATSAKNLIELTLTKNAQVQKEQTTTGKRITQSLRGLGYLLGISQLALSFLGARDFMKKGIDSPFATYPFATLCTATVTYLFLFEIPNAMENLKTITKRSLKQRKITTIGAKIAPKLNTVLLSIGMVLNAFSWGDIKTLGREYFKPFGLEGLMEVILPLGYAFLTANSIIELTNDALKAYYRSYSETKEQEIETYLKLEELEQFFNQVSLEEIQNYITQIDQDETPLTHNVISSPPEQIELATL